MKLIAIKTLMIMPALLLQTPSKTSKAREHLKALERRLVLWEAGDLHSLVLEAETIQESLQSTANKTSLSKIARDIKNHMKKGEINAAMKVLSVNMRNGILPLDENTSASRIRWLRFWIQAQNNVYDANITRT